MNLNKENIKIFFLFFFYDLSIMLLFPITITVILKLVNGNFGYISSKIFLPLLVLIPSIILLKKSIRNYKFSDKKINNIEHNLNNIKTKIISLFIIISILLFHILILFIDVHGTISSIAFFEFILFLYLSYELIKLQIINFKHKYNTNF